MTYQIKLEHDLSSTNQWNILYEFIFYRRSKDKIFEYKTRFGPFQQDRMTFNGNDLFMKNKNIFKMTSLITCPHDFSQIVTFKEVKLI